MNIIFVCMGNICRSPLAEGAFRAAAEQSAIADRLTIDSAGTIGFHAGKAPDHRSQSVAKSYGWDISAQKSRQITADDIISQDYILVMDQQNLDDVLALADQVDADGSARAIIRPMLDYAPHIPMSDIPDPYYGHMQDFELVARLVADASIGLIADVEKKLKS